MNKQIQKIGLISLITIMFDVFFSMIAPIVHSMFGTRQMGNGASYRWYLVLTEYMNWGCIIVNSVGIALVVYLVYKIIKESKK